MAIHVGSFSPPALQANREYVSEKERMLGDLLRDTVRILFLPEMDTANLLARFLLRYKVTVLESEEWPRKLLDLIKEARELEDEEARKRFSELIIIKTDATLANGKTRVVGFSISTIRQAC